MSWKPFKYMALLENCHDILLGISRKCHGKGIKNDLGQRKTFQSNTMGVSYKQEFTEILKREDPFKRTAKILKNDLRYVGYKIMESIGMETNLSHDLKAQFFPTHTDILIIGGGAIGSSIAYWLKQRAPNAMHVVVLENETSYSDLASCLFMGSLTQQFSIPENILMSQFTAEFLRDAEKHLSIDDFPVTDVQFHPKGHLVLATTEGAARLHESSKLRTKLGSRNILLSAGKLKERFPWMNTTGVEIGCLGLELEGWFNPASLVNAFKRKSINLGADYIEGNVVGFEFKDQPHITPPSKNGKYEQLNRAVIKLPNNEFQTITFGFCILAAGAQSGEISRMMRIGEGEGLLSVPLPIEPRKRYIYGIHCSEGPSLDVPLVTDPSGVFFRREGLVSNFIAGMSQSPNDEVSMSDQDVDCKLFDEKIGPLLSQRVPALEGTKAKYIWTRDCEYNAMDENGVIGNHPYNHNLYIACGFNGQTIQHAPAVGRAIMELLLDGEYKTIDLSRLGFERLCLGEPLTENIRY